MALLDKQVAIVTGGGRGIGRAIAMRLAALGASVVVTSRNAPELDQVVRTIKRAGGRALAQTADIADERQVEDLVLATERWVGPATIVINNAGVVEPITPLARADSASWLRNLAINVGGTFLVTRAALPGMLARDYGRIITIGSSGASKPPAGWTAYGASKAALVSMTIGLSRELRGTGVGTAVLDPGIVDTSMQERIRRSSTDDLPTVDWFRREHEAGHLRSPDDVAVAAAYLASPQATLKGEVIELNPALLEAAAAASQAGSGDTSR